MQKPRHLLLYLHDEKLNAFVPCHSYCSFNLNNIQLLENFQRQNFNILTNVGNSYILHSQIIPCDSYCSGERNVLLCIFQKKEIIIKKRNKISRILYVIQLSDRVYNVTFPA